MNKEEIFVKYHSKVQNYIMGKVCDKYLAEDLASTVFLKIYERLDKYDETKAAISTWIYTIANNTVIDYYRTRKVGEEIPEEIAQEGEIDAALLSKEQLEELADALRKIEERERDIIILHYYENMSLKDIAEIMGMSYSNVKLVHNKALMRLRNNIKLD